MLPKLSPLFVEKRAILLEDLSKVLKKNKIGLNQESVSCLANELMCNSYHPKRECSTQGTQTEECPDKALLDQMESIKNSIEVPLD